MKLKSVLETLDGLDEAVKQYYSEKDGKFYLRGTSKKTDQIRHGSAVRT